MPSLNTHFKPHGITFHMNGQSTKLESKQACNKCKNLKKLNSRIGNIHWLKLLWIFICFHMNYFLCWLYDKYSFKERFFSSEASCSSTGWCFHLLCGNMGKDLFSMNIWQQDDAKPRQTNMVMNLVINLDFSFFWRGCWS